MDTKAARSYHQLYLRISLHWISRRPQITLLRLLQGKTDLILDLKLMTQQLKRVRHRSLDLIQGNLTAILKISTILNMAAIPNRAVTPKKAMILATPVIPNKAATPKQAMIPTKSAIPNKAMIQIKPMIPSKSMAITYSLHKSQIESPTVILIESTQCHQMTQIRRMTQILSTVSAKAKSRL